MLYGFISDTLLKLHGFFCSWDLFLISFITLILDCLNLDLLLLWFVLDFLIYSFNSFLIWLVMQWRSLHNTFIRNWFYFLDALIFHTDFLIRNTLIFHANIFIWDTLVFHARLHIINTDVTHTWGIWFHAGGILHTLVLLEEYRALNWAINWLQRIISLNWLIYHPVVCWLNRYIMKWRLGLLGHTNTLWNQTWPMINCILDTNLWSFIERNTYTLFRLFFPKRYSNSFIWFIKNCSKITILFWFLMTRDHCNFEWLLLNFQFFLKRFINHIYSLDWYILIFFLRLSFSQTSEWFVLNWWDIV